MYSFIFSSNPTPFEPRFNLEVDPELKYLGDITPGFKHYDRTNKENDRPISILRNLSKVFEKFTICINSYGKRIWKLQNMNVDL